MKRLMSILGLVTALALVGDIPKQKKLETLLNQKNPEKSQMTEIEGSMEVHQFEDKNQNALYDGPEETIKVYKNPKSTSMVMIKEEIPGKGRLAFYPSTTRYLGGSIDLKVIDTTQSTPIVMIDHKNLIDMKKGMSVEQKLLNGSRPVIYFNLDDAREIRKSLDMPSRAKYTLTTFRNDGSYAETWMFTVIYPTDKTNTSVENNKK